ncbi:MAG: shikimate kinase, partial [Serpentinimonas sp.]|nr:shikimate kinase [Serpentinimonas sp.]
MIILIGLPGSGKSTVGRLLARRLQLPFVDSDSAIEQRLGCSIREFF